MRIGRGNVENVCKYLVTYVRMLIIFIDRVGALYHVITSVYPHPRPRTLLGGYILPRGTDDRRGTLAV